MILTVGTTFSGIGAPEQALKNLGIQFVTKWACDIKKSSKETYLSNHTCEKFYDDITKIDINSLEYVDLYVFGFPCQDCSIVGKQDLNGGRTALVQYSLDIIDKIKPKYILFENVFNLLNKKFEKFFRGIKENLESNYNFDYRILNSIDFGVPQSRRRVFGIGIRKDLKQLPDFNLPVLPRVNIELILESNVLQSFYLSQEKQDKIVEIAKEMVKDFQLQPKIGIVNGVNKFNKTSIFSKIKIQYKDYCSCLNLIDLFGIIDANHNIRTLTPREYARLQGFPDSFILHKNNNTAYKQFGNTITVNVLESIFKKMFLKSLTISKFFDNL